MDPGKADPFRHALNALGALHSNEVLFIFTMAEGTI
jgi:hypothetical protein